MNKKYFIKTILTAFFAMSGFASYAADNDMRKPNIIIILADDLGYADVGFHGSDIETPHIDRIASEGVVLEQYYACPMCSPTRAGLMTGRYPIRFGLMRAVVPPQRVFGMPPEETTIAEMLSEAGYKYRGITGKWHLGHQEKRWTPANQGFTFFEGCHNGAVDYFTQDRNGERDWQELAKPSEKKGYTTDLIGNAAIEFIQSVPKDEPFFLYVPFTAPHSPFQAKDEDLEKYPNREGDKKTYAAMIDCMDQNIGRILASLEDRGQLDNTFILFCSDNGGVKKVADNSPHRGSKLTVYEGGINVVAAARWPAGNISGGKIIKERVGYIDVFPTIAGIAGCNQLPADLDGIDMIKALQGEELPDRTWFTYLDQGGEKVEQFALNTDEWKLIWRRNAPDNPTTQEQTELYRIGEDRGEVVNVNTEQEAVVEKLKMEIGNIYKLKSKNQIPRYDEKEKLSGPVLPNWFHEN
ncbi:sulfatase-like hydrolase/transferase [Prolixibacteraceae bacterium Z1-6]|uniref:Sulfatase-like hydrolase/transferase n=1 Tax=Draconibacterium aestuarii TaxID=2998507 RepID=A0A9X3F7P7_9BACT|nr:sulfatase-like hydrolase/transferase [Prolixibacteraceae bacterium Z1-6]